MKFFNQIVKAAMPDRITATVIKYEARKRVNKMLKLNGQLDSMIDNGMDRVIDTVGVKTILVASELFQKLRVANGQQR